MKKCSKSVNEFITKMNDEILTTSMGYQLTKEKLHGLLKSDSWLCDQIVNTALEKIQFKKDEFELTDSFFFTELISLNERLSVPKWTAIFQNSRTWVIPVNFDRHWSLMVLKNDKIGILIECLDSMPTISRMEKLKQQLLCSYQNISVEKKSFSFCYRQDCYMQADCDNCGVFLIGNIRALLSGKNPCNIEPKTARIGIASMIISSFDEANQNS